MNDGKLVDDFLIVQGGKFMFAMPSPAATSSIIGKRLLSRFPHNRIYKQQLGIEFYILILDISNPLNYSLQTLPLPPAPLSKLGEGNGPLIVRGVRAVNETIQTDFIA